MKQLVLLRGCPGVGKSTWVKENGLEPYTISADIVRTQWSSLVYDTDGKVVINQEKDHLVWKNIFQMLESRMEKGEFTVIDATHSTNKLIQQYKNLVTKYGYRVIVVDFKEDLETIIERNLNREEHKHVPIEVIENIHERLKHEKIPSFAKVIEPADFENETKWKLVDFNRFDNVHVFGDIHGCFTALNSAIVNNDFDDLYTCIADLQNEAFVFVGDYFDRGLENGETFEFFENVMNLPNVFMLEGNHERHVRKYGESEYDMEFELDLNRATAKGQYEDRVISKYFRSRQFVHTYNQFQERGITPKRARVFTRKLLQCLYFEFGNKKYLITHGGILPNMVENLNKVSTHQLINGVGGYEFEIDDEWDDSDVIQIHGHRNIFRNKLDIGKKSINLEGRVEKGGHLRSVTLFKGAIGGRETENNVFNKALLVEGRHTEKLDNDITITNFMEAIGTNNKDIKVKHQYDNVHSVNFTNRLFSSGRWNKIAVHSRGLFVKEDNGKYSVLGRGYNKFFNINEMKETKIESLVENITFPLTAYEKHNGYLGLLVVDNDELVFSSKSTTHKNQYNNDYALDFKRIMEEKLTKTQLDNIKNELKLGNLTAVFEVISPEFDPHIVKYDHDNVVLLDLIYNDIHFSKLNYDLLCLFAKTYELDVKGIAYEFKNWNEFYEWYKENKDSTQIQHEGFVFEDSNGFMFKYKTKWYTAWKYMRGIKDKMKNRHVVTRPKQYILQDNPEIREFFYWLKHQHIDLMEKDIIELREMFYKKDYVDPVEKSRIEKIINEVLDSFKRG